MLEIYLINIKITSLIQTDIYGADYKHRNTKITFYKNKSLSLLDLCDVVSREGAEYSSSLRSSHKPSVITFLHDVDDVSLQELHLILVLGLVVVESAVTGNNNTVKTQQSENISPL